jgi:hypothetical protein
MPGQMTVAAVRRTGHVVGALTGAGGPSIEQVAGPALPVRFWDGSATVVVAVPAGVLAVAGVAADPAVFADPTDARVVFPDNPDEDPTLELIASADSGELDLQADNVIVRLEPPSGSVTLAKPAPVLALFQGAAGQPPVVLTGELPAGTASASAPLSSGPLPHTLESGATYDALVLVAGLQPSVLANQTVP